MCPRPVTLLSLSYAHHYNAYHRVVVGNGKGTRTAGTDGTDAWSFDKMPPISTYLFAVAAGGYISVKSATPDGIPLGLYARKSMQKQLEEHADELLTLTKQGLDFYPKYFDCPYPFRYMHTHGARTWQAMVTLTPPTNNPPPPPPLQHLRPAVCARVQRGRHGERWCRHVHRALLVPRPTHRCRAYVLV